MAQRIVLPFSRPAVDHDALPTKANTVRWGVILLYRMQDVSEVGSLLPPIFLCPVLVTISCEALQRFAEVGLVDNLEILAQKKCIFSHKYFT